jgi:hypothetical protein
VHVWVNGAFGVGKSSTAEQLVGMRPSARLFDAEWVGYMLAAQLKGSELHDFQDLPAWRRLVPVIAREIADHTSDRLVVVQTVLNRDYWSELAAGIAANDLPIFHVVLDADSSTLRRRIEHVEAQLATGATDQTAIRWRLDHIDAYVAARDWLISTADLVVDAGALDVIGVADTILHALPDQRATAGAR